MKLLRGLSFILMSMCAVLAELPAYAQGYTTSLGVRIGGTSGVSVKHFYKRSTAFEGVLGFFGNGFSVTGLLEKHEDAFDVNGLKFYYGAGAHLSAYENRFRYYDRVWRDVNYDHQTTIALGIDGIAGLEYVFDEIPIALSLDLKPFIEVGSGGFVGFSPDPSIGIKIILR